MSKKKAKEARAERSERKPNWQEVYATVEDIQQFLSERVMLGRAFRELGFQSKTSHNIRGYIVIRRSAEEMRAMRQQMAYTDTDDTDVF